MPRALSSWNAEPPEMYGVKVWNTPVVSEKRVTLKKKKMFKYVSSLEMQGDQMHWSYPI